MTLSIFTEPAKQAQFISKIKEYITARVPSNTGGAASAAAASLQDREVSELSKNFDHCVMVTKSLMQYGKVRPNTALDVGIKHLLADESKASPHHSLIVYFVYQTLQNTTCFTLDQKQKLLQDIITQHTGYDKIISDATAMLTCEQILGSDEHKAVLAAKDPALLKRLEEPRVYLRPHSSDKFSIISSLSEDVKAANSLLAGEELSYFSSVVSTISTYYTQYMNGDMPYEGTYLKMMATAGFVQPFETDIKAAKTQFLKDILRGVKLDNHDLRSTLDSDEAIPEDVLKSIFPSLDDAQIIKIIQGHNQSILTAVQFLIDPILLGEAGYSLTQAYDANIFIDPTDDSIRYRVSKDKVILRKQDDPGMEDESTLEGSIAIEYILEENGFILREIEISNPRLKQLVLAKTADDMIAAIGI